MKPVVLYVSMIRDTPSQVHKLDGIRRYCSSRGWTAEPVYRDEVSVETLPGILAKHKPVGCVVEGVGRLAVLRPGLFRRIPVSYIGYMPGETGRKPNFRFDADSIAATAFRELSADKPPCFAVVGHPRSWDWSRRRVRAFRAVVAAAGGRCHSFPTIPRSGCERNDAFVGRLVPWLAALPEHCAMFVVSDETAFLVARAARLAGRHIPRSLTLLSVDNFAELCEKTDPPISSIHLDFEREGYFAAAALEAPAARGIGAIGPLMVVRRKSTSGRGRHEKFILEAIDMIRREACDGLTAAELIGRFPVSKRLFNLRFREATGHSPLDEILHARLEKACTLLARTGTAVGAVPSLCGFGCDRTLDALFRSRFGMSMSDWRRLNGRPFGFD